MNGVLSIMYVTIIVYIYMFIFYTIGSFLAIKYFIKINISVYFVSTIYVFRFLEIMDVDKSGTTTHIIQKTTHMTLVSHATSDNGAAEGMILFLLL